jgi:hypothetical protein
MQRPLDTREQDILNKLLDQCTFDVANLRAQAASTEVWNVNDDGSILRFESSPSIQPAPMPSIHLFQLRRFFETPIG